MNKYKEFEKIKEQLLYKTIKSWDNTELLLDDGTVVEIVESEYDCCASAKGEWSKVKLDAVITDVRVENMQTKEDWSGTTEKTANVIIYHNQNEIAQADCYANDGNGGYYYSVCSLKIKEIHYPIIATREFDTDDYI